MPKRYVLPFNFLVVPIHTSRESRPITRNLTDSIRGGGLNIYSSNYVTARLLILKIGATLFMLKQNANIYIDRLLRSTRRGMNDLRVHLTEIYI